LKFLPLASQGVLQTQRIEVSYIQSCNEKPPSAELIPERDATAAFAQRETRLRGLFVAGVGGNSQQYNVCLTDLAGHLRHFFRKKLQRLPDEIEDLVQETLIAVHNQRHTYDAAQPFTAWAYAIARYKLIDRYRQFSRHDAQHETLDEVHELTIGEMDDEHEARRDIGKLLDTLPEKQRVPIQLVKIEGLSVAEAAEKTGQSESAIKVNVHRGLKALAAKFGNSGTR
jgi:RNA polymerase sigma-70 factor, ECF subfamily